MEYKLPIRIANSNKSTYGRVLNIAGSDFMPGAALLSSLATLKIGAGYCFLYTTDKAILPIASQSQNIVFVSNDKLMSELNNSDVVSIGCGLTTKDWAKSLFLHILSNIDNSKPLIIDADGLNILSTNFVQYSKLKLNNVILTPHPKEAASLLSTTTEYILKNLEDSAKQLAKKYNATIALKTHRTIISTPDEKIHINNSGNNALAKAGSGDVLTGMIAGLVAQKLDIFEAVKTAVYLHGLSGELASKDLTQYCVLASDIINYIPVAIKTIK